MIEFGLAAMWKADCAYVELGLVWEDSLVLLMVQNHPSHTHQEIGQSVTLILLGCLFCS